MKTWEKIASGAVLAASTVFMGYASFVGWNYITVQKPHEELLKKIEAAKTPDEFNRTIYTMSQFGFERYLNGNSRLEFVWRAAINNFPDYDDTQTGSPRLHAQLEKMINTPNGESRFARDLADVVLAKREELLRTKYETMAQK